MKKSAGILLYRIKQEIEFFLVHPGGPYFLKKDSGIWTIPKGEFEAPESPYKAALREFAEETGYQLTYPGIKLDPVQQKGGKMVYAWAIEDDIDPAMIKCNTFKIEWPPKSGKYKEYPEVDKAGWFIYNAAIEKINPAQLPLLDQVKTILQNLQ